MLAQMESQTQASLLSVTITSAFPGFQRSMTFQNGTWFVHDLTHHFHDDAASLSYSSASAGVQRSRPLQLFAAPPPSQQTHPITHSKARLPAGSPALCQLTHTPPDMSNRPLSEQAILPALQAMAANSDYSDFMPTMEQHWPVLLTIALPRITIPNILANFPH